MLNVFRWIRCRRASFEFRLMALMCVLMFWGCKDLSEPLPAGTQDPATYNTKTGALGMRTYAIWKLAQTLPNYIIETGLLTDELQVKETGSRPVGIPDRTRQSLYGQLDNRLSAKEGILGFNSEAYDNLHMVRAAVSQATGALAAYYPDAPAALRGELYAIAGYAEMLLADFYCSGVPLSTLDFGKDFTYKAGSTTQAVYAHAIENFDSALALAGDSARIMNLARVGKGRALVNLGQYTQAATVVGDVEDGFQYQLAVDFGGPNYSSYNHNAINAYATISDREGGNGLSFLSGDPRTRDSVVGTDLTSKMPLRFPVRYSAKSSTLFPLANWIEARLIRAEAALSVGDTRVWLEQLNYLRAHATVPGMLDPLPALTAPASDSARVTMLMSERAFWLFLSGHRQGDLRRLIRQYGRSQNQVYPMGLYYAPGTGVYGTDVVAAIRSNERNNPLFSGCLNYGA